MITVFGIRHHGPGSTKSLLKALEQLQPDCVLIEGPKDAEAAIDYIADSELKPPVALLIYNPKNLKQASYFPFASFSPEWQAIKFALRNTIPIRLMDLPMGVQFAANQAAKERIQLAMLDKGPELDHTPLVKDPLAHMAELAGYTDSERWWEVMFEQQENDSVIFDTIVEMMGLLREEVKRQESPQTLLREAFMRKQIRLAVKEGFQNIAIVCGAWHAPVLQDHLKVPQKNDNAILKGLKKVKIKATWIPWTYHRLAFQSGYRAGVVSPAWYDLLYNHEKEVNTRWMVDAARLLRSEDLDASAAHALESVRLAESLATLRGRSVAGIEELEEAAISVLCSGHEKQLELIRQRLVIGDRIGHVPDHIPQIPLQQDLGQCIKSARLSKERNSTIPVSKELDLRKGTNLSASHLLHRLLLLNISWGKELPVSENSTGSFKEIWTLTWDPEFEIHIIEAGMWGNTVEEAAANFSMQQALNLDRLNPLTTLAGKVLKADLPTVIPPIITRLQEIAALSKDTLHLMEALMPLVQIIRYGSARRMNTFAIEQLVEQLVPRISIGLPLISTNIDEEQAMEVFRQIISCNSALTLLNKSDLQQNWYNALQQIVKTSTAQAMLSGVASRILFDKGEVDMPATATQMAYALSPGNPTLSTAQWIEGFLHGSGLLLIYNPNLWMILDDWVAALPEATFMEIVPILRRTFSKFPEPERQKMLTLAKGETAVNERTGNAWELDEERANIMLPTLKMLFED